MHARQIHTIYKGRPRTKFTSKLPEHCLPDIWNSLDKKLRETQTRNKLFIFLKFLTKWLTSAILDVRNSLSIAFLAISDRYATLFFFGNFCQNGCRRPFWMSEIHFRSQCWPFQIDTELFGFSSGHFGCPQITFDRISGHFRSIRNFLFCLIKWPPAAILDGTTMSIIELVRDIWMSNACVKFEERSLNPSKVIALTKL